MRENMNRQEFLNLSAASLAALAVPNVLEGTEKEKKYVCKIKILRRSLQDFVEKYNIPDIKVCSEFKDDQEFIVESPWNKPDGFCGWAWADIRTYIHLVYSGRFEKFICCCTDGLRPVFFYLSRVEVE
jgi:uncharacterized repeat protein (TIGR04076 family)